MGIDYDAERGSYVTLGLSRGDFGGKNPKGGVATWLPAVATDGP